MIPNPL